MRRKIRVQVAALLGVALVVAACTAATSTDGVGSESDADTAGPVTVLPDVAASEFIVSVDMTAAAFVPAMIHIPAGRYIKLILHNRDVVEHHYRVIGLVPSQLRWLEDPLFTVGDRPPMTADELQAAGVDLNDVPGHELHHVSKGLVPFKPESPAGITPLGTEVHGYAGTADNRIDAVYFYALTTGTYAVECVLHPEIKGSVIVFLPDNATVVAGG